MNTESLFLEAEAFEDLGGWVVDQQFMDVMGSPYLLAHGLGVPVADASTHARFPAPGIYRVWVRTRDWTGPWKTPETPYAVRASGSPGIFQVLVNGQGLPVTFGDSGSEWRWQDGGLVEIHSTFIPLALHDLTGFEGRCDALFFSQDLDYRPPDGGLMLQALRREWLGFPDPAPLTRPFNLVVAGGGIAGTCAALAAARSGLQVALIQDRPVLGGNNSSEVRVWLGGKTNLEPYPRLGDVVAQLEPVQAAHYGAANTGEIYEDVRRLALVKAEPNLKLYLGWRVVAARLESDRILEVTAQEITSGRQIRFSGDLYADCTGDGDLGALAGADYEMTRLGHLGPSNLWNVVDTGEAQAFPRCPWALDLSESPFPGRQELSGQFSGKGVQSLGAWFWESGFDAHPIDDMEKARDINFRAMYGAWDALKNVDRVFPTFKLNWAAYITGLRESRRLLGEVVLTQDEVVNGVSFPDGAFPCTWTLDLHSPDPDYQKDFKGSEFISTSTHIRFKSPYWAPYRCLYSRNIQNLFMAGRNISVSHEALGTVRVMRTTGMMGEVVGLAAALCKEHGITPARVYHQKLADLLQRLHQGVPRTPRAENRRRENEGD
jgi:hypothetical protein